MKKTVVLSALAVAAFAGTAFGQIARNDYRLDLSVTLRSVAANVLTDVQTGGNVIGTPGTTYRLEVRYRINDGNLGDQLGSRGLTNCLLNVTAPSGTISNALLSVDQGARSIVGTPASALPLNPDNSCPLNGVTLGLPELGGPPAYPVSGVTDPYRGGIGADNGAPGNGVPVPGGRQFTPLSLSAPGQNSFTGLLPNNNSNTGTWALVAVNFLYTGGDVTVTAAAFPDGTSGNAFAFWDGGTVPATSTSQAPGTIRFTAVPTPASAALLGLGGLVAARRRRA